MIEANYVDGSSYRCGALADIDFKKFIVPGIVSLQVGGFTWDAERDGRLKYHFMRTKKTGNNFFWWRVYILVAERQIILVFSDGAVWYREEWMPGHEILAPPQMPKGIDP